MIDDGDTTREIGKESTLDIVGKTKFDYELNDLSIEFLNERYCAELRSCLAAGTTDPPDHEKLCAGHPQARVLYHRLALSNLDILISVRGNRGARVENYLPHYPGQAASVAELRELIEHEGAARVRARGAERSDAICDDLRERFPAAFATDFADRFRALLRRDEVPPPPPGYEFLELLGQGGEGKVYKAVQRAVDRLVAIKVHDLEGLDDDAVAKIHRTGKALASVKSEYVVGVIDYIVGPRYAYLVMDYFPRTLRDCHPAGRWPLVEALRCSERIAHGVARLHEKSYVHRDLKAENILLADDGIPKIADLGLHVSLRDRQGRMNAAHFPLGTPHSMPPELANGQEHDDRVDIFGIGTILYQLLTGRPLYGAGNGSEAIRMAKGCEFKAPRELVADIPKDVEAAILKALAREPKDRYDRAETFRKDLGRLASKYEHPRVLGFHWDRRAVAIGIALVVLMVLLPIGVAIRHKGPVEPQQVESVSVGIFSGGVAMLQSEPPRDALMQDTMEMTTGDQFHLQFIPNTDCHVYVVNIDAANEVTLLYPHPEDGSSSESRKDVRYNVPRRDDLWLTLQGRTGREQILLLATRKPVPELEALRGSSVRPLSPEENGSLRRYLGDLSQKPDTPRGVVVTRVRPKKAEIQAPDGRALSDVPLDYTFGSDYALRKWIIRHSAPSS